MIGKLFFIYLFIALPGDGETGKKCWGGKSLTGEKILAN